jgi:DNA-binding SARP family transcriptional activator/tetratricopeptide (TPR) repeat protein
MALLQLALLGGFQARSPTGAAVSIPVKKAKALLAYLALHPGHSHPRDKLAALLWEDSGDAQARHSLRQALVCLRKAFPRSMHVIAADDDALTIPPQTVEVDVLDFERLLETGTPEALEQAVALYQGELLEGFNPGSSGFEDWLMERRGRLRERAISAVETLLARQLADKPGERAIGLALRLVSWDPLRESTHRALMTLYARLGRHGAAFKQYQICRAVLHRELGVEPEPQTEALYRDLLQQRRAATSAPLSLAGEGRGGEDERLQEEPEIFSSPVAARPEIQAAPGNPPEAPELRQASVLIARLVEDEAAESLDLEERHAAKQDLLKRVQAASIRFGGGLVQVQQTSDAVMAVFGIPQAHGNDAERAVRTALTLQQADADADSPQRPVSIRTGIASGPVLVSRWPAGNPHGYLVTGDAVQTAGALCARAGPAETLVSDAVYASLREKAMAEALPSPDAPRVWRLQNLRAEPRFEQSAFIGRRAPLRQFASILETCRETGCGQVVLVRGDAGIGKTRLVEECVTLARTHGFACHRTTILDFGVTTDRDALTPLLYGLLDLPSGATVEQAHAAVAQILAEGIIEKNQDVFLNDLLGLPQPAGRRAEYDAMRHEARHQGKQATIGRLTTGMAARQPRLLIAEDIHWADAATLDLLARLAVATQDNPVVLVMTSRLEGEPLDPAWRGAMHGAALLTLDLGPLRPEEVLELTRQFGDLDTELLARCVERAGGNPLFLEQLLRAAQAGDERVPDSVQSLVWATLDRLSPGDRTAVQAAAILGQRFTLAAVRHLLGDPDYRCVPLIEHRLVRPDGADYLFAHVLIQEGIYVSLRPSRQRELHRRAAAWFVARDRRLHAEHLDRAGDPGAARAYLSAAREQTDAHRLEPALRLARRGLALALDPPTGFELAGLYGELLRETGQIDASIAAFEQALAQAPTEIDRARAWLGVARGLEIQDRYSQALDALDQAQRRAGRDASVELLAQIHIQRGNISFPLGRIDECFREHELALRHARAAASPLLEARALSGLGDACYQRGRMLSAHRHFEQLIALCREHGLAGIEASNLAMLGVTRFYQNDLAGAEREVMAAIERATRIGNQRDESLAFDVLGLIHQYEGRWSEARASFERSLELARGLGARRFEAESLGHLAFVMARLDPNHPIEQGFEQAWTLIQATSAAYSGPWILSLWALVTDDAARRARLLAEGEALLGADSVGHNYLHFYQNAMEAALNARDWSEVERYAAALAAYTAAEPLPWSAFFIARARVLARHGHGERTLELTATLQALLAQAESSGLMAAATVLRDALALNVVAESGHTSRS